MPTIDFPSQVPATDPIWLLGANATAPAKAKITVAGRAFIQSEDDAAMRAILGLGSAATQPSSAFDPAGAAAAAQAYTNPSQPTVHTTQEGLDILFNGVVTQLIAHLTSDVLVAEIGQVVNDVHLSWTYNKVAVTSQSIAPTPGPVGLALRDIQLTALGLIADTTFTLTASDGGPPAVSSVTVAFQRRRFWGVSAIATPASGAFIDTLANSELANDAHQSRNFDGQGQYLYFAWPASFGPPTFLWGPAGSGDKSTGWVKTTVSYTNSFGHTEDYDIYRSSFIQWGADIPVTVE